MPKEKELKKYGKDAVIHEGFPWEEELKTLEDLKTEQAVGDYVWIEKLKQEAIKWIKERISKCVYACRVGGMICKEHKFWMERFNITEEDLK